MTSTPSLFGLLAEFPDPPNLMRAATELRDEGYSTLDAFTPFPVDDLPAALGKARTRMPRVFLLSGIIGGVSIYALQYWVNVVAYPINIGGRPLHSWPSFIPPTFECTVLGASLAGIFGMLWANGLPRLHHPLFAVEAFKRASTDGFFLCVESTDEHFELEGTRQRLRELGAMEVHDVPLED